MFLRTCSGGQILTSPHFLHPGSRSARLADVVHAQGRCAEGLGVKEFGDWKSVYIAAPNVPAAVLRGLARYAGLTSTATPVTFFTLRETAGRASLRGGKRTFRLPRAAEVVSDAFTGAVIARNAEEFGAVLPAISTTVFYHGPAATLKAAKASDL